MSEKLGFGQIITTQQFKDAIHVAVIPVVAAQRLDPGEHISMRNERAIPDQSPNAVGVVDPFLRKAVREGDTFWLFLYPGSITSLRHAWTHPAFPEVDTTAPTPTAAAMSESEAWMRKWAMENMSEGYYGDGKRSPEVCYAAAIEAGNRMHIGPYESARESINDTWWNHWEKITGQKGQRGEYFSCSC